MNTRRADALKRGWWLLIGAALMVLIGFIPAAATGADCEIIAIEELSEPCDDALLPAWLLTLRDSPAMSIPVMLAAIVIPFATGALTRRYVSVAICWFAAALTIGLGIWLGYRFAHSHYPEYDGGQDGSEAAGGEALLFGVVAFVIALIAVAPVSAASAAIGTTIWRHADKRRTPARESGAPTMPAS